MRDQPTSRRTFVQQSAATLAAVATVQSFLTTNAHAAGSDTLRVGLIGCGGRGTGAVVQALTADKNTRLVALADAFKDRLDESLEEIKKSSVASQVDVPSDRQYVGFDAYKNVLDQVDVAILTTPPHFRPLHLAYAVEKGVHTFVEKPVATDAPGVRAVLKLCEEARKKNLSVVSGFQGRLLRTPARGHE